VIERTVIRGGNSYYACPVIVHPCTRQALETRRRVDPQDAGDILTLVVIAVRQRRRKKGRVPCSQPVEGAIDFKIDFTRNDETKLLADMSDQTVAAAARRQLAAIRLWMAL